MSSLLPPAANRPRRLPRAASGSWRATSDLCVLRVHRCVVQSPMLSCCICRLLPTDQRGCQGPLLVPFCNMPSCCSKLN
jgi:hypothetical protein